MRLIGPNCIGVVNTDPNVGMNATFGPSMPPTGRVAFASQSGALGLAAIQEARRHGIGISDFVSMGNKADISGNDLLQYWESDPRTDVILLYLESFGNPRKFARIARRVGRTKPIVAIKSGRSAAGARATASHTGALVAASDVTVDALFRQAGVIRADTIGGLFDIAALLATQPIPKGQRVGIVTNVGGPAILCADTCEAEGLVVASLAQETTARLRRCCRRGERRQSGRHAGGRHGRAVSPGDRIGGGRSEHRRCDRDLHSTARHAIGGRGRRGCIDRA